MLHLSPGYQKFEAFCALAELEHDQNDEGNDDFIDDFQEEIKLPVPERENRKRKVRTEEQDEEDFKDSH
jgi:hypothetical protein